MAIEEARQARHDIRHHFVQLSSLAEQCDIEKIRKYLSAATGKISGYNLHFCENQAVDSVFGYYSTIAERENIPFHALVSLPADLSIDSIPMPFPERLEDWKILFFCCILPSKVFSTWIRRR